MRIALLLAIAALAGCAEGPTRSEVLAGLVGHPEADAIRTLGAPNRILPSGASRFLAYDERRLDYVPAPGFVPFGYGAFVAPSVPYERVCETTVEIVGGKVRTWTLRGNAC